MEDKIIEIANRLKGMREILDFSQEKMAQSLDVSEAEYVDYESGEKDFSVTFLYKAANVLGIDLTELMTGTSPKLSSFSIVRKGEGLPVQRREEFSYQTMSHRFKNRKAEVFIVKAYKDGENLENVEKNSHQGQEFDYILSGKLKIMIGDHEDILNEGDMIYYDSSIKHKMVAVDGDCEFMAVLIK